jgi:hypothetical protein
MEQPNRGNVAAIGVLLDELRRAGERTTERIPSVADKLAA